MTDNKESKVRKQRRLLTLSEVATTLRISVAAARKLILYEEAIPHIKVGAPGFRVREADLEKYIDSKQQTSKETTGESQDTPTKEAYKGRTMFYHLTR